MNVKNVPVIGGRLDGSTLRLDCSHLISHAIELDGDIYDLMRDPVTTEPIAFYGKQRT